MHHTQCTIQQCQYNMCNFICILRMECNNELFFKLFTHIYIGILVFSWMYIGCLFLKAYHKRKSTNHNPQLIAAYTSPVLQSVVHYINIPSWAPFACISKHTTREKAQTRTNNWTLAMLQYSLSEPAGLIVN